MAGSISIPVASICRLRNLGREMDTSFERFRCPIQRTDGHCVGSLLFEGELVGMSELTVKSLGEQVGPPIYKS